MRCTPLKNRQISVVDPFRPIRAAALGCALAVLPVHVGAAEFLSPLPVQELKIGESYRLGIRPSKAPARSTVDAKLSLYVEGLSVNATFLRTADELWEFTWLPTVADQGVHVIRILVTERNTPTDVLEVEEITLSVGEASGSLEPEPSSLLSKESVELAVEAVLPTQDSLEIAKAALPPAQNAVAVAPLVSTDLAEESITISARSSRVTDDLADTEAVLSDARPDELGATVQATRPGPERSAAWALAPIASQVVTPHQWVRFPVQLIGDSDTINERIALQVDQLPNGASFEPRAGGGRQFEWRPNTADQGEHVFQFTAIDTEDGQRRESTTMRIIVQE